MIVKVIMEMVIYLCIVVYRIGITTNLKSAFFLIEADAATAPTTMTTFFEFWNKKLFHIKKWISRQSAKIKSKELDWKIKGLSKPTWRNVEKSKKSVEKTPINQITINKLSRGT